MATVSHHLLKTTSSCELGAFGEKFLLPRSLQEDLFDVQGHVQTLQEEGREK